MWVSSRCATSILSRRLRADISPNMAEAATPATEVPKASPKPLMGAANAARIACRSVLPSREKAAPFSVTTMPRKVPNMPSITNNPTK